MKQMQQETTNLVIVLLPGKGLTAPCNTIPTPGLGSTASICVTPAEEGELEILPLFFLSYWEWAGISWAKWVSGLSRTLC